MKKNILLIGGSGFIGLELGRALVKKGYLVRILTRNKKRIENSLPFSCEIFQWDEKLSVPSKSMIDCYAVVNLAGASVASRWTKKYKKILRYSRIRTTQGMVDTYRELAVKPKVIIQASAIGVYGDRDNDIVDEDSIPGKDFLSKLAVDWEKKFNELSQNNLEAEFFVLRFGMVLGSTGGALLKLANLYAKKLGSVIGSGGQWVSWVHVEDVVRSIIWCIEEKKSQGTYNIVSSNPVSYKKLHKALVQVKGAQVINKVPAFIIKIILGEQASLILNSTRVSNQKLTNQGFLFKYEDIEKALQALLAKTYVRNL